MRDLKGNVGEWCELLAFLLILIKYQANVESIAKIKRCGYDQSYYFLGESLYINGVKSSISVEKLQNISDEVSKLINSRKNSGGITANKSLVLSLSKLGIVKLKSPSKTKTDIQIDFFNIKDTVINTSYYSIKSFVNSNPTVVNASTRSCLSLIFENDAEVKRFLQNESPEDQVRAKIKQYIDYGLIVKYGSFISQNYVSKLKIIDSLLPDLLAKMIFEWVINGTSNIKENISAVSGTKLDFLSNYDMFRKFILSEFNNEFETNNCSVIYINKKLNVIERKLTDNNHLNKVIESLYFDMPSKFRHMYRNKTPGDIFVHDGCFITTVNYQIRLKKF